MSKLSNSPQVRLFGGTAVLDRTASQAPIGLLVRNFWFLTSRWIALRRLIWAASLIAMTACLQDKAVGREWSEEIRMTFANEQRLSTEWKFPAVIDASNRIHLLYKYLRAQVPEEYDHRQAVYQGFDAEGRPLSEPQIVGLLADYRDTIVYNYDLAIGPEGNIYLLWGCRLRFLTVLDSSGEVIVPCALLNGLGEIRDIDNASPMIFADSQGNLIVVSGVNPLVRPRATRLAYARYSPNGELLDSMRFIGPEGQFIADFTAVLDIGDTLYVAYQENINDVCHIRYSKIAPNDEFIVNDYAVNEVDEHRGVVLFGLNCDQQGRPYFLLTDFESQYLIRLNRELETDLTVLLGPTVSYSGGADLKVINDNVHILITFWAGDIYAHNTLAYLCVSDEGEILDSLQVIHTTNMNEGGIRDAGWTYVRILSYIDNSIVVLWDDSRNNIINITGREIYMRHSVFPGGVKGNDKPINTKCQLLQPNYPNPFNNGTFICIKTGNFMPVQLLITDLAGRLVKRAELTADANGRVSYYWNGFDYKGLSLPAGSYMLMASDNVNHQIKIVTLVK